MSLITTCIEERVAVVTLDDPERRNAVSLAMAEAIHEEVEHLATSAEVGAVVITGAPPAFSAGADLKDLEVPDRERIRAIYEGFLSVARCPLPTIAAVNGAAVGAGLNLAMACDIRVAATGARFESRFLDLGLHPGGGHTWMLRQLLGPQGAAALVLCGETLDGEAAVARGLAWTCVDDDQLIGEALRLARRAASAPREMLVRLKDSLRSMAAVGDHATAVELELEPQLWSLRQPEFQRRLAVLKRKISKRR